MFVTSTLTNVTLNMTQSKNFFPSRFERKLKLNLDFFLFNVFLIFAFRNMFPPCYSLLNLSKPTKVTVELNQTKIIINYYGNHFSFNWVVVSLPTSLSV